MFFVYDEDANRIFERAYREAKMDFVLRNVCNMGSLQYGGLCEMGSEVVYRTPQQSGTRSCCNSAARRERIGFKAKRSRCYKGISIGVRRDPDGVQKSSHAKSESLHVLSSSNFFRTDECLAVRPFAGVEWAHDVTMASREKRQKQPLARGVLFRFVRDSTCRNHLEVTMTILLHNHIFF